jgi:uncharacterized protein
MTIKKIFVSQGFTKIKIKDVIKHTFLILLLLLFLSYLISFISILFNISDLNLVSEHISKIPFYLIIYLFIVRVFLEEWFFRGFLVKKIGCLLSSALFAIVHIGYGSIVQVIGAFALGFILAKYYEKINNIIPLFLAHLFYNSISYFFMIFI